MQHTAATCSTLQHTATHMHTSLAREGHTNTKHTATHYNTYAYLIGDGRKDPFIVVKTQLLVDNRLVHILKSQQRCNTHCRTHYNTLHHTASHCITLHHTVTHCWYTFSKDTALQDTLQDTLHRTASRCSALRHTETRCNTLQRTATRCTTPHHIKL